MISRIDEIIPYLRVAMSEDYYENLPEEFFKNVSSSCKNDKINSDQVSMTIDDLKKYLENVREVFTSSKYYHPENKELYKEETAEWELNNEPFFSRTIVGSDDFKKIYNKALFEIGNICSKINRIGTLYSEEFNEFIKEIKRMLNNDTTSRFKRSFVNYSVFQFNIKGYPYNTQSRKIWSISNIKSGMSNAELEDVYHKNIDAIIDGLYELNIDNSDSGVETLKNAFCIVVLLSSLYSEEQCRDKYIRLYFEGKEVI